MMFSENDFRGGQSGKSPDSVHLEFFSRFFPTYTRLIVNISAKVVDENPKRKSHIFG